MEPRGESPGRLGWIALAALGVALLVGLAILLDRGPFADEELTGAEFVKRGDEICAQAQEDFEDLQESVPTTAGEAAEVTEELVAIALDELDGISDLSAPAELDAAIDRYLVAREAGIDLLRDGVAAAEDGDALAYARAQADLASSQLKRERLARQLGFSECSRVLFGRGRLERDSEPPVGTDPAAPPTVANPPTGAP
jgi:hypothetical protein